MIIQLLCFPRVDSESSVLQYFLSYDPVRDGVLCWAFVYHGWLLCHVKRQPKICNHIFLVWFWNALNRAWYTRLVTNICWNSGLESGAGRDLQISCTSSQDQPGFSLCIECRKTLADCIRQEQMNMHWMSHLCQVPLWLHDLGTQHLRHHYQSAMILNVFLSFLFCTPVTHFLCVVSDGVWKRHGRVTGRDGSMMVSFTKFSPDWTKVKPWWACASYLEHPWE